MADLDRLLAAAREATPEPLGEAEAEVLLEEAKRRARASSSRQTIVEHVLDRARLAEPDPLTDSALHAMAERAAMTGRARHRGWTRRRVMMTSALAATVAAAAVTLMLSKPAPVDPPRAAREPASEPSELALSTGDRLVALSGARFDVEVPDSTTRRVRLRGGAMLFDVRPIEGGRFSVSTPNAEVEVLGTVFSVRATERATTVWVYEGSVRVRGPDGARVLEAGGVIHLGAGAADADALAAAGEAAAARRAANAAPAPSVPEPIQPPEPAPPRHERRAPRAHAQPERGADSARTTPAEARGLIANGDPERALAIVRAAIDRGERGPWRMLEGDALRVLHRLDEAAIAYQRAARELPPPRRQQAGFLEARLRMTLNDLPGALRALRSADVTAADSALRERGLVLELELLDRLDRRTEAADIAREYLRDYPEGPDAPAMRAHAFSSE